jgi:hypothetical protein
MGRGKKTAFCKSLSFEKHFFKKQKMEIHQSLKKGGFGKLLLSKETKRPSRMLWQRFWEPVVEETIQDLQSMTSQNPLKHVNNSLSFWKSMLVDRLTSLSKQGETTTISPQTQKII